MTDPNVAVFSSIVGYFGAVHKYIEERLVARASLAFILQLLFRSQP